VAWVWSLTWLVLQLTDPGCRLPGDVKSTSGFWDLITSGRSAQSDVPTNRFDIDKWHHPNPKRRGGIIARGGYFLSHDDSFRDLDPSFFGIHPLEAASMDPQQRKLLEVVYETFESAGVTLEQMSESPTACYVGSFTADFVKTLIREPENHWPYQSTGTDMTILSNRVNYVFNLKGPR
jgi:acyl transferase domain-containing protein